MQLNQRQVRYERDGCRHALVFATPVVRVGGISAAGYTSLPDVSHKPLKT